MKIVYFDTTTTGRFLYREVSHAPEQPHLSRLAFMVVDNGDERPWCRLIKPRPSWHFEPSAAHANGVEEWLCHQDGIPIEEAMAELTPQLETADVVVAYNLDYHRRVLERAMFDVGAAPQVVVKPDADMVCVMRSCTNIVKKPGFSRGYQWPRLAEAYTYFSGDELPGPDHSDPLERGLALIRAVRLIHLGVLAHHEPRDAVA